MRTTTWTYPALEKVFLGPVAGDTVQAEAKRLGAERVFVVTSRSVAKSAFFQEFAAAIASRHVGTFGEISAHAPLEEILAAASGAREARADLVVAVGGGSAIDAAKVVILCLGCDVRDVAGLAQYRGFGAARDSSLRPDDASRWVRLIAVPTTLSAAEFTYFGGGYDASRKMKDPYPHPMAIPRSVVMDPRATQSAPMALFLSTGMKALDHSVERIATTRCDALSEIRSLRSIELLSRALPRVKANPDDLQARLDAQTGAALGMASPTAGVGVGASHAVGHVLGGNNGVQHGHTSCVMLAPTMRWVRQEAGHATSLVSAAMGRPGEPPDEVIRDFVRSLDLPYRLRDIGVSQADFPQIAAKVMHDHSLRGSPRQPTRPEDIVELLELAW